MKKIIKNFFRSYFVQRFLSLVIFLYLKLVYHTSSKKFIFDKSINKDEFETKQAIFAFWHGRLAMMPFCRNKTPINVLTSPHSDGRLIGFAMEELGFNIIEGSSSKKGFSAYKKILELSKKGESIAITPDGPRGPAMQIGRSNVVKVAYKTKLIIIPVSYSAKKAIRLKSWDRFLFPLPFNKLFFIYGASLNPSENYSEENIDANKKFLEATLNNLCYKADKLAELS